MMPRGASLSGSCTPVRCRRRRLAFRQETNGSHSSPWRMQIQDFVRVGRTEGTIVSEGFKGGTRGAPIMPRDVSLSDSKCWNGGHEWVLMEVERRNAMKVHTKVEYAPKKERMFDLSAK